MAVDAVARPQRPAPIVRGLIDDRRARDLRHGGRRRRAASAALTLAAPAAAAGRRLLRSGQGHGTQKRTSPTETP